MKIFYAVQATGNGHISRAMEVLPYLENYGEVDVFLSGANSTLELSMPIKFRSNGLSLFYTCNGGLNYSRILRQLSLTRIRKEINELPVHKYDLVLNDFDCITSMACARRNVPSIHFGHQASFLSPKTPRPEKINKAGEWLLKNYAKAGQQVGLHFESYDDFILSPVIKRRIVTSDPRDQGHITVYLPSYCLPELLNYFGQIKDQRFHIFTWEVSTPQKHGNIIFHPVSNIAFSESMINCQAIICGAGFEAPAEALYLGKKMMVMPIKGQYEQKCNAAALERLGVRTIPQLDASFGKIFDDWITHDKEIKLNYEYSTGEIISVLMQKANHHREMIGMEFLESAFR
jgi:uncharacterized protein (TIGR00661 family)